MLEELDIPSVSLHSGKPQRERMTALNSFKSSICSTLIATDVASRGLDIPTVDLVINFDLPMLARDYVHRVGRTARAGRSGWCLSFVTQYDVELVHKIESLIDTKLDEYELPEDEVLKGITKVYSAKRTASVKLAEEKASDKGQKKRARKT
jgi:ATP-dependent RNA helicase DDX49/DBP8